MIAGVFSPEEKKSGRPMTWVTSIKQSLRRVVAVSGCELRIQTRSPALWIIVILTILVTVGIALTQGPAPGKLIDGNSATIMVFEGETLFTILLLPFLLSGIFLRDKRWRFTSLLWSRPLATMEYALGKGLGGIIFSLFFTLPPLIVGWIVVGLVQGGIQPIGPWLSMIPVVAAIDVLAAMFALLCINLVPWPLLGALASSGIMLYLGFIKLQTLLEITNLVASTVFYSSSIGFGPDESLLFAQRTVYLALGLFCLFLLLLAFQFKERRGATLRMHRVALLINGTLTSILVIVTLINFGTIASGYQSLGPAPSAPIEASITHYQLAVTLDPDTGTITGNARFILTPAPAHQNTFYFALNSGLNIKDVSFANFSQNASASSGTKVDFSSSIGWTKVDLGGTTFAQGQPVQLIIDYNGRLMLNRDAYAQPMQAFGAGNPSEPGTFLNYVGQGAAFLEGSGSGDWYPLPWTRQAISAYGNRQAIEEVSLRLPSTFKVFCSLGAPKLVDNGQWQVIDVFPQGVLPMAFLAALNSPAQIQISNIKIYFRGVSPTGQIRLFDQEMVQQLQATNKWLESDSATTVSSQSFVGVVVPLIQKPVVGPGLLLLPEIPMLDNASYSTIAEYRVPTQAVAEAWWLNAIQFSNREFINLRPSLQNPTGSISFPFMSAQLFSMVTNYTGAVITNGFSHGFLDHEMAVREIFHKDPNKADPLSAFTIGIDCCAMTDPPLALYHLQQKIGVLKVTELLQRFAYLHIQASGNIQDFLALASKIAGYDVTPQVRPYLNP